MPGLSCIMSVKLTSRIPEVLAALKAQVAQGVNDAASFMVDEAQDNANVDTGFMQSHIGMTEAANAASLSATVRSLAPYSLFQDVGKHGNLFWTKAFIATREKFPQLMYQSLIGNGGKAGRGVIKAAKEEFEQHITGRGLRVTKLKGKSGGRAIVNKKNQIVGIYGGKRKK